jgi:hypothetical protein
MSLDSTSSRIARFASSRGLTASRNSGSAERTSSASFCQNRRRKVAALRLPRMGDFVLSSVAAGIARL